jgi:hypothetical protein
MRARTPIALAGSAAVLAAAGWFAAPAFATSASTTLHLSCTEIASHAFGKTSGIAVTKDTSNGKVVAYDTLNYTNSTTAHLALALNGGFLYGQATESSTGVVTGKITDGTGPYAGDTGTITGQITGAKTSTLTITYKS